MWGKGDLYTWHPCSSLEAPQEPKCVPWAQLSLSGSRQHLFYKKKCRDPHHSPSASSSSTHSKKQNPKGRQGSTGTGGVSGGQWELPQWAPRHGWEWSHRLKGPGSRISDPSESKVGKELGQSLNLKKILYKGHKTACLTQYIKSIYRSMWTIPIPQLKGQKRFISKDQHAFEEKVQSW